MVVILHGVTTIAGGYSLIPGRADGPGLNASFSDDFELSFVPERCTLMISDHGSKLVREIQLKAEDCSRDSHSALKAVSTWFLTVGLPCLVCLILGLVIRPYVIPNTGTRQSSSVQHDMEALPNQSGETSSDVLLRHQKRSC
ncbi:PREDICTED: uncharacterized protein LOC109236195 isoform X2 [Nicotiana attenuata]|uniref:uncharacterized protein LOC109236195 isoform X2 n=1 Tax=Nicotiana attenuata TaxID=49451 RepID=UPI000905BEDF|nr:PREDICTED: uncharacterized protein LOC109236195 isoform X2 [Nicotiana attenuata]